MVFVVAGRLGSPCAVARHGSKSLGPGEREREREKERKRERHVLK